MSVIKDEGICIRLRKYSETSQIVTFFTRDCGKVAGIAKGSRRPHSKFGGGIDLLANGVVIFVPARGERSLATLTEFTLRESFTALRRDLLTLQAAQYAADMLAEFTEELDPHERLYDAFYETLAALQPPGRPESRLLMFELTLLGEVGLRPQWDICCGCGKGLPLDKRLYFSSNGGGMLCPQCEPAVAEKRFVEPDVLRILRNPTGIADAEPPAVVEAHLLLSYHQRELLGKQTTIATFLNQLLGKYVRAPK